MSQSYFVNRGKEIRWRTPSGSTRHVATVDPKHDAEWIAEAMNEKATRQDEAMEEVAECEVEKKSAEWETSS